MRQAAVMLTQWLPLTVDDEEPSAVHFQKLFVCHLICTNPIVVVNLKLGFIFRQALLQRLIGKPDLLIFNFQTNRFETRPGFR